MSTTKLNIPASGIKSFNAYLADHEIEAKTSEKNDLYYHVNVVAEAYTKGFSDGKKEVLEVLFSKAQEKFIEKANQVYLSAKSLVDQLKETGYSVDRIYINAFRKSPKVLVVVDEDMILNDSFVEFTYSRIHEMQVSFHSLFSNTLDLSLIGKEDLDECLLKSDGFEYSEKL